MPNVIFALTQHGGHLGFFEGAGLFPQPLTWMDKVIVEFADAICQWESNRPPRHAATCPDLSLGDAERTEGTPATWPSISA